MGPKNLFVIMPFGIRAAPQAEGSTLDFDRLYKDYLKPAAIKAGWSILRIDELATPGRISDQYLRQLATADLVLADISVSNSNVSYELGVRHSLSPGGTILIAHEGSTIPFDLAEHRVLFYRTTTNALTALETQLIATLEGHVVGDRLSPVHAFLERVGIVASPKLDPAAFERDIQAKLDRARSPDQLIGLWEWLRPMRPLPLSTLPVLANRLADHERWEVAANVLDLAASLRPGDFELHRQLGWYLGHMGPSHDKASLKHLQIALDLNPRDPESLGMLGGRLKRLGRYTEAAEHFDRAAEVSQRSIYIEVNRAACRVLASPQNPERGLSMYRALRDALLAMKTRPLDEWDEIVLCEAFFIEGDDSASHEHLTAALSLATSPKTILSSARHLELFVKTGYRPEAASTLIASMRQQTRTNTGPTPTTDEVAKSCPVFIHMSDLHFGGVAIDGKVAPKHRFFDGMNERPLIEHMREEFDRYMGLAELPTPRLHLIASGDFTYVGSPTEFDDALDFLNQFVAHTNIPKSRVHIVPGNHDVNWHLGRSDASQRFDNYLAFVQKFYGSKLLTQRFPLIEWPISLSDHRPKPWELLYFCSYPEHQLLIAGLNTCVYESEQHHFGFVGERQMQSLRKLITQAKYPRGTLKVAVMHHHLHPLPEWLKPRDAEQPWLDMSILRDSGQVESYLAELGFDLLVHGHKHKPLLREVVLRDVSVPASPRRPLIVCGAGSIACNALEHSESNQYQIIETRRLPRTKGSEFLNVTWRVLPLKPGAEWTTSNVFPITG